MMDLLRRKNKKVCIVAEKLDNPLLKKREYSVLGVDFSLNKLLVLKNEPFDDEKSSKFSLLLFDIDCYNYHVSLACQTINLFSSSGVLNVFYKEDTLSFNVHLVEVPETDIQYIVYGYERGKENLFIYFTLIFRENDKYKPIYFSFPCNSSTFEWNPETSFIKHPLALTFSSVSSIKTVIIDPETKLAKFKSFDVDKYFSKVLGDYFRFVEQYDSNIVGSSESTLINLSKENEKSFFLVFIGYIFYSESNNVWKLVSELHEFPIVGDKRVLSKMSKSFERRPSNKVMKEELKSIFDEFKNLANSNDIRFRCMDNFKSENGIRKIDVPEYNLILLERLNKSSPIL